MALSVRTKWVAALLAASLGPLAAFGVGAVRAERRGLERAEQELEAAVVDDAARTLSFELGAASTGTERVAATLVDARLGDEDLRIALAKGAVVASVRLERACVYDAKGAFVDAIVAPGRTGFAEPRELAASERLASPRWVVTAAPSGARARYVVPLVVDGAGRGWVVGDLDAGVLSRVVSDLSQDRFQRRDRVAVVSTSLEVLGADASSPWKVGASAEASPLFRGRGKPLTQALLYTESFARAGEPWVGTVRIVPELGWAVAVERPEAEAYAALGATYRALGLAFALAALASAALGWALGARTVGPIASLVELTRRYGKRELGAKNPVATGDELEELGAAMETMARDISAGEAEIARRAAVEAGLSRYLPREVAAAVAAGERSLDLRSERRKVAILFADVAGFTPFAERESPERVVAFLNELFGVVSEVVFRHGGMVDKYMGDCVMAVFGAPAGDGSGDPGDAALACAEDIHRFVEASAPAWKETYGFDAKLAIGASYGDALLGDVGGEVRVEYTAIGDAVNVAARLEALAGPGKTLVTAALAEGREGFSFESLGRHPVRGRAEPVEILEVRG